MTMWREAAVAIGCAGAAMIGEASAKFDSSFFADGADFSNYSSVCIEIFSIDPDTSNSDYRTRADYSLDENEWASQEEALGEELTQKLSRDFDVVDTPGPGVLVVHATLTELKATRATPRQIANARGGYKSNVGSQALGGAAATFEISDFDTGKVLARFSDRQFRRNFLDGPAANTIWFDASRAFDEWGRDLRRALIERRTAE